MTGALKNGLGGNAGVVYILSTCQAPQVKPTQQLGHLECYEFVLYNEYIQD